MTAYVISKAITVKFLWSQKLHADFGLHGSLLPQPLHCSRVSYIFPLYYYPFSLHYIYVLFSRILFIQFLINKIQINLFYTSIYNQMKYSFFYDFHFNDLDRTLLKFLMFQAFKHGSVSTWLVISRLSDFTL